MICWRQPKPSASCQKPALSTSTAFPRVRSGPPSLPSGIPNSSNGSSLTLSVWTEKGSPTLADRRKKYAGVSPKSRRPVNPAFVRSIFTRDHPGTAYADVVRSYADAICALDDSIPNGTYIDMCERLPLVDPKKITVPVMPPGANTTASPMRACSKRTTSSRIT